MSKVPAELQYTDAHLWVRTERDGTLTVGLTDHAQQNLGTILFITLPEVGVAVGLDDAVGIVEALTTLTEIYSPADGEIIAVNPAIAEDPEVVNTEPYASWLFTIRQRNDAPVDGFLDAAAYSRLLENLGAGW
ncbi:glycine cleavage system protein GcvH [Nocardia sp. X0981]